MKIFLANIGFKNAGIPPVSRMAEKVRRADDGTELFSPVYAGQGRARIIATCAPAIQDRGKLLTQMVDYS